MRQSDVRLSLTLLAVTTFGSVLSSLATYTSVAFVLDSGAVLAFLLFLKTFSQIFWSYLAPTLISRNSLRTVLTGTQVVGLFNLGLFAAGFAFGSLPCLIGAVLISGFASALPAITTTVLLKTRIEDAGLFRRLSGLIPLFSGISIVVAGLVLPDWIESFGILSVFACDAVTYLIAIVVALRLSRDHMHVPETFVWQGMTRFASSSLVRVYLIRIVAGLSIVALLPILAGTRNVSWERSLPELLRAHLWTLEGGMNILAYVCYFRMAPKLRSTGWVDLLLCNSVFLVPALLFVDSRVTLVCLSAVAFGYHLSTMRLRDDLVLAMSGDANSLRRAASLSRLSECFMMAISPLVLSAILNQWTPRSCLIAVVIFQSVLTATAYVIERRTAPVAG